MNTTFRLAAAALTAAILTSACSDQSLTDPVSQTPIDPAVVAGVAVSPAVDTVGAGATSQFSVVITDTQGATQSGSGVAWTTTDASVAVVSTSGLMTAAAPGSALIIASIGGKADTSSVTVMAAASPSTPPPATGTHAGYHVAPGGSASGDGSASKPWSLAAALSGASGKILPGDTVWMHGGTYTGSFSSSVSGAAGQPVVFRQYPNERAIIDAAGTPASAQSVLRVGGAYTVFWGFEITNTDANRLTSSTGHGVRPNVVANYASHTKYINLVVHDGGVAFYNEPVMTDVEITGCVIYNNGWQGPDRGHGHALYLKSDNGSVLVRDNIMFNQYGFGVHLYSDPGSGNNNIRLEGNVAFNNGTLSNNSTSANMLIGGEERAHGNVLDGNMTYYTPGAGGVNVQVGFSQVANGDVQLTNNYFVGGSSVLQVNFWDQVSMSGNTLVGSSRLMQVLDNSQSGYSLGSTSFFGSTSGLTLTASDVTSGGTPSATKVVVRKSPFESGRANIVVYNWGGQSAVTVNLASIVPAGARWEIHNVQNLYGAPVASGTGGSSATIAMSAVQPPAPVGSPYQPAPSTGTAFNVYVVTLAP